jgi:AmmeMemoRadiSam system protein A
MSSLGNREKQLLLGVARSALILAVRNRESLKELPKDEALQRPGGVFVTLHYRGRLRGCVGQLASKDTLAEVVAQCSKSAALEDPRFEEVSVVELPGIEIELSVLSAPVDVRPEQIQPGKHGLLVSCGWKRGVLLPQVAAQFHWNAQQFLEETCAKADLARDAWENPATRVQAFTAEVFSEADFPAA